MVDLLVRVWNLLWLYGRGAWRATILCEIHRPPKMLRELPLWVNSIELFAPTSRKSNLTGAKTRPTLQV
jgi:hypothetical protein